MPFTDSDICKIILAIFLPPLGVFAEKGCECDLLINILLCCLGYIPVGAAIAALILVAIAIGIWLKLRPKGDTGSAGSGLVGKQESASGGSESVVVSKQDSTPKFAPPGAQPKPALRKLSETGGKGSGAGAGGGPGGAGTGGGGGGAAGGGKSSPGVTK
ncbi:unnamed protein product, partial [Medioppia subpectinata]